MNKRLSFLSLPDEPLDMICRRLDPKSLARLISAFNMNTELPSTKSHIQDIGSLKIAMAKSLTPCPTELIFEYRPFAKGPFKDQLDDYIQSYINTNLKTEKTELFGKLKEEPENKEEKTTHIQEIRTRITNHPILVFATVTDGPFKDFIPLHLAALNGHTEIAQTLIATGDEVNAKDEFGCTPLHLATHYEYTELARLLITNGADGTAKDKVGCTPLHLAGNKEIADLLRNAGAKA